MGSCIFPRSRPELPTVVYAAKCCSLRRRLLRIAYPSFLDAARSSFRRSTVPLSHSALFSARRSWCHLPLVYWPESASITWCASGRLPCVPQATVSAVETRFFCVPPPKISLPCLAVPVAILPDLNACSLLSICANARHVCIRPPYLSRLTTSLADCHVCCCFSGRSPISLRSGPSVLSPAPSVTGRRSCYRPLFLFPAAVPASVCL